MSSQLFRGLVALAAGVLISACGGGGGGGYASTTPADPIVVVPPVVNAALLLVEPVEGRGEGHDAERVGYGME